MTNEQKRAYVEELLAGLAVEARLDDDESGIEIWWEGSAHIRVFCEPPFGGSFEGGAEAAVEAIRTLGMAPKLELH